MATAFGLLSPLIAMQLHSAQTQALDANNDGAGLMFNAPKTGNISHVYVVWGTKTGTAPTYRIGIETGTTTRAPDGTYLGGGSAYADQADPTASSHQRFALGASAAVTAGVTYWATVRYNTGTINGSNFINLTYGHSGNVSSQSGPTAGLLTAGTWTIQTMYPTIAVEYDDGTIVGVPVKLQTNHSWGSGGSPLYRGTCWTPGVTCEVADIAFLLRATTAGADFNVHIMEGTNATPLQTILIDQDVNGSAVNPGSWQIPIAPITCTAGTAYRFLIEPTTATSINTFVQQRFYNGTVADAIGAGSLKYTSATSLGTYSADVDDDFALIMPIVRGVTVSSGGGAMVIGG